MRDPNKHVVARLRRRATFEETNKKLAEALGWYLADCNGWIPLVVLTALWGFFFFPAMTTESFEQGSGIVWYYGRFLIPGWLVLAWMIKR